MSLRCDGCFVFWKARGTGHRRIRCRSSCLHAQPRKLPQTLSGDDIRKLIASTQTRPRPSARAIKRCWSCSMRLGCGSRNWSSLRMHQINFQGDYLTVKGKGSKVRAVPFGKWAREKLDSVYEHATCQIAQGQIESVRLHQSVGQAVKPPGLLEAYSPLRSRRRHR